MAAGKTASVDRELFLLRVNYRGEIPKNNFISKCIKKPERFNEDIAKQKTQTFEIELERKKIQRSNAKAVTTCFVGDLSDSLLFLSLIKKN